MLPASDAQREAFRKAFLSYWENFREKWPLMEKMKPEIRRIRENAIENMFQLIEKARKNLEARGVNVFLAKDAKEARKILLDLIPEGEKVAKAKSSTLVEIGALKALEGRNEIVETDCGDFLVSFLGETPSHPIGPAMHLSLNELLRKVGEVVGRGFEDATALAAWVREEVRRRVKGSKFGLTGCNALSSDGSILLLENEGNIGLVSGLQVHIAVCGIDKIVESRNDALKICEAQALWGSATMGSYVHVISGPSKTRDIGKVSLRGMYGARTVNLILVDNGRSEMHQRMRELLYCINCGSCLYFCPFYRQILWISKPYAGVIGALKNAFLKGDFSQLYACSLCGLCELICPVDIRVSELVRRMRVEKFENAPRKAKEVCKKIDEVGNPYGGEELARDWYCC